MDLNDSLGGYRYEGSKGKLSSQLSLLRTLALWYIAAKQLRGASLRNISSRNLWTCWTSWFVDASIS